MTSQQIAAHLDISLKTENLAEQLRLRAACVQAKTDDGYGERRSLENLLQVHAVETDIRTLKSLIRSLTEDETFRAVGIDICDRLKARNHALQALQQ